MVVNGTPHHNLLDNMPMHIGKAAVDPVVVEAELLVVEPEQMQSCGMEVVAIGGVLSGFEAELRRSLP